MADQSTKTPARQRTATRSFGASERASHDASAFYGRRLYEAAAAGAEQEPVTEGLLPTTAADRIFCCDSRQMVQLPDNSVHLMVTSPPYGVGKDYDDDLTLDEFRGMLIDVFRETYRVLTPGGRACINVANLGRKPYIPLASWITLDMIQLGYQMRGEIIWDKGASAGGSCAWGSWRSASDPQLRDRHEYILIFSKQSFKRPKNGRTNTVGRDEFLAYTQSVWQFGTESARKVGHPAPFPVELPSRLIELYTYQDDVVLDPFCGSGTSCIAALRSGRHYVGYDINPEYVALAERRIAAAQQVQTESL